MNQLSFFFHLIAKEFQQQYVTDAVSWKKELENKSEVLSPEQFVAVNFQHPNKASNVKDFQAIPTFQIMENLVHNTPKNYIILKVLNNHLVRGFRSERINLD